MNQDGQQADRENEERERESEKELDRDLKYASADDTFKALREKANGMGW